MDTQEVIGTSSSTGGVSLQAHRYFASLTVAIPALNEERNIESAVRSVLSAAEKVPDLGVEIVVVDDGSTDRTAEIVRSLAQAHTNVRLVQNATNLGLGASIRRGIHAATSDKFLFIPGDNDIPVATLETLFRYAYAADVVMCYFLNDECRGRRRYFLSGLFKVIYSTTFGLYGIQYVNGPAVYPTEKLRQLELHSTRFSIVAEINVKLLRQGVTFLEVPSNRQVGLDGSTSSSLGNLVETVRVYLQTLGDVYLWDRGRYSRRPIRVPYELMMAAPVYEPRGDAGN